MTDELARALEDARRMMEDAVHYDVAKFLLSQSAEVERLREKLKDAETERDEAVNWNDIVDRHGTDQFDDLAEAWLSMEPIQRVHNAVASVFSNWANDELMVRFKRHMSNSLHLAFVEGCIAGVRAAEAKSRADSLADEVRRLEESRASIVVGIAVFLEQTGFPDYAQRIRAVLSAQKEMG